jgi:hypothetical protein
MAQDITIAGAQYEDVGAIDIAKTGGGLARFVDTSDADATADDILIGKTAYVNGQRVVGTGSAGNLEIVNGQMVGATVTLDKTYAQIADYLSNGKTVVLSVSGVLLPLRSIDVDELIFTTSPKARGNGTEAFFNEISVDNQDVITLSSYYFAITTGTGE